MWKIRPNLIEKIHTKRMSRTKIGVNALARWALINGWHARMLEMNTGRHKMQFLNVVANWKTMWERLFRKKRVHQKKLMRSGKLGLSLRCLSIQINLGQNIWRNSHSVKQNRSRCGWKSWIKIYHAKGGKVALIGWQGYVRRLRKIRINMAMIMPNNF